MFMRALRCVSLARELGVDLALVKGSGAKGRIRKQDLQNFVKMRLAGGAANLVLV